MSSSGMVINSNGTIHNGCPLARAVQFCMPEAGAAEVYAEFSSGGGGSFKFKFHVDQRMTTIDLRGWTSVRFWLEDDNAEGLRLRVFWRDALLCTENLFYQMTFQDDNANGSVDGQYIPVGAYEFICSAADASAVFQVPGVAGGYTYMDVKAWQRYPVLGTYFAPTVECFVHFFLKI